MFGRLCMTRALAAGVRRTVCSSSSVRAAPVAMGLAPGVRGLTTFVVASPLASMRMRMPSPRAAGAMNAITIHARHMSQTSKIKKWKTKKHGKSLKTRKAVAKRFILTGKGKLKHGHSGKRHNTSFKSMVRLRRLNKMNILEGQMAKNMHKMIIR